MQQPGTVSWYSTERGYGMIAPEGGGPPAFVHDSAVHGSGLRPLAAGDAVAFELLEGEVGPVAENVSRAP